MKKIQVLLLLLFINGQKLYAQELAKIDEHKVKHLSFSDTFFGNEDMYQVCYPKDHRSFFYSIIIFAVIALSLGAYIIYFKSKNNKLLTNKNQIIEEKNKDLTDSIKYAQRIQNTMVSNIGDIKQRFEKSHLFYQPKDIVSGDYVYYKSKNNIDYLVVADCTGHGVPGALLTVLGINALHNIIDGGIENPSEILDHLNTSIKKLLQQGAASKVNDGMELALVVIDTAKKQLQFAGANRPLVFQKNNEVQILKGAKCTVGSHQEHVISAPETNILQFETGNRFFIFSDGITDQFGGTREKKYTQSSLIKRITEVKEMPAETAFKNIEQSILQWKGNALQTDDMTLLAIEL